MDPHQIVQIAPSILNADFLHLGAEIEAIAEAGVQRLQIDVMDGRFVPNISVGLPIVQAVRSATDMLIEAHLMIVEPERYVRDFASAGADLIIVHVEPSPHIYRTLQLIHAEGKRAGVALNPGTPLQAVSEVLHLADLILVMTVNPGFGGQEFIAAMLPKIEALRAALSARQLTAEIEVDGGINTGTAPLVTRAGARVLVAGTAIFRAASVEDAVRGLRAAASRGLETDV